MGEIGGKPGAQIFSSFKCEFQGDTIKEVLGGSNQRKGGDSGIFSNLAEHGNTHKQAAGLSQKDRR